ncbi:Glycosyltransferase involved in cell wall bisynthesis [Paraburkholderia hospita]|nr:glycosyltransferase [Paraburkholderia hospita]SKC94043.1 Glycosyltransferase involved in cell wall bisynthesis [Paraburkholderia hospita]
MRIVQIGRSDLLGARFNGYSITSQLRARGITSTHLVHDKRSQDDAVSTIFAGPRTRNFISAASKLERRLGHHAMLQLNSFGLPTNRAFWKADVAHYHIIHDGFFSLAAMPLLSRVKPTVWTWHDPWPMTGHCIYPMDCERWRIGCGSCPDLDRIFSMEFDNTRKAFALKRRITRASRLNVVLASEWMMDMARASPMAKNARLHYIPFGIDLNRFIPRDQASARAALGVKPGYTVIAARGVRSPYKGAEALANALDALETPVCIISLNDTGVFDRHIGRHQVIGLDWSDDEDHMIEAYTAADFFVMPSTAEAFGMMAIEAMGCGKPVIVFEGTSLPEVTFAPECGIAVPMGDAAALAGAIRHLVVDEDDRKKRGLRARQLAEEHYSAELYADRLAALYREVAVEPSGSAA